MVNVSTTARLGGRQVGSSSADREEIEMMGADSRAASLANIQFDFRYLFPIAFRVSCLRSSLITTRMRFESIKMSSQSNVNNYPMRGERIVVCRYTFPGG
jgi:hypothetical protein